MVEHAARRTWALAAIGVTVGMSLLYVFWWGPVVRHVAIWIVPGDIWSTFRDAHMVGWGDIGGIYDPNYGLLTFPASVILLTPVAMTSGHFGLSESIGTLAITHPSAYLLLGPAILLLGSACLLAFDALAESLGISRGQRIVLLSIESVLVFQVVTLWGHPEDMTALGLAAYALLQASRGRWTAAGWLWGLAIATQPLVLVVFPLAFAMSPSGQRMRLCFRSALPTTMLLAIPLLTQWGMTTRALLHQSNMVSVNHPTPWMAFSAHTGPDHVSAGPGRIVALLAAVAIGALASRLRPSLLGLVWLSALALALRCFFESVMVPFYLGPPFALIVLACALRPGYLRLLVASTAAVGANVLAYHHLGTWSYWLPMVGLLALALACGWPGRADLMTRGRTPNRPSSEQDVPEAQAPLRGPLVRS